MNDNDMPSIWPDRRQPLKADQPEIDLVTSKGLAAIRRAVQAAISNGLATAPPPSDPALVSVPGKKARNARKADSQAFRDAPTTHTPR